MGNMVYRVFKARTKAVDAEKFTVEATVSDESIDRYNEVILVDAWKSGLKKYKAHPVLLSSHRYSDLTSQIGVGERLSTDEGELVAKFKYFVGEGNPQADWGFRLAEKGLAAFSVGFIPKAEMSDEELEEWSKGKKIKPRRVYKEVELLEISQVLIPANANALQRGLEDQDPVVADLVRNMVNYIDNNKGLEVPPDLEDKGWEQTDNEIRHRIRDPKDFQEDSFRYMTLKKSKPRVNAVIGKLKGEDKTTIQALRFPKADGWTMAKAKEWVKEHPVKGIEDFINSMVLQSYWDLMDTVEISDAAQEVHVQDYNLILVHNNGVSVNVPVDIIVDQVNAAMRAKMDEFVAAMMDKELPDDTTEDKSANPGDCVKEIFQQLDTIKDIFKS